MGCAAGCGAHGTPTGFFQALSAPAPRWRLVLDTNVVLDLLHFADATVTPIRWAIESGNAQCCASQPALDELSRVLTYPAFQLDGPAQAALLARYQLWVGEPQVVTISARLPRCIDPDDQMFLELAASSQADILISKDKALLALKRRAAGFRILTPNEAVGFLASHPSGDDPLSAACSSLNFQRMS